MKDLTVHAVSVLALALALGLVFRWVFPLVELTPELAGLFLLVALGLRAGAAALWSRAVRRAPAPPQTPTPAPPQERP